MRAPDATLDAILRGLLDRYKAHVPEVDAILAVMRDNGIIRDERDIENDHIAFRTLGVPHLGIASLEKVFLAHAYQRRDRYDFPAKKVTAHWYAPPDARFPRIFISELRVPELSADAQRIIHSYSDVVSSDPVETLDLHDAAAVVEFLHGPLWHTPTWEDYSTLLGESEFAAWVIYNRYYLNHFTIAVHNLPAPVNRLAAFNEFLERNGFTLNDAGGKIKVSADGKLLQSSTVAALVEADFAVRDRGQQVSETSRRCSGRREDQSPFDLARPGTHDALEGPKSASEAGIEKRGEVERHRIAGSYVEFAERQVLDEFAHLSADQIRREHRREGFEAASADKIFESTYTAQTGRKSPNRQ